MPFNQPVKILMKPKVLDILETDTLTRALTVLDEADISALPVRTSEGGYRGVLSRTDISRLRLFKLVEERGSTDNILVGEVMNRTPPVYVTEDTPIQEAVRIMHRRGIHRLFVANQSRRLVGVISSSDIMRLVTVS